MRNHKARRAHLAWLRECIATERIGWQTAGEENVGGSRPAGRVSDPTGGRVVVMETDPEYRATWQRVRLVEHALEVLTPVERQLIQAIYIDQTHNLVGAALLIGYSRAQTARIRQRALAQVSREQLDIRGVKRAYG
ncbi:hypothetical protein [Symbiobacterium thermophilum]|nr:hypothetical protein [Symbiobacterium thermophilum]